MYLSLTAKQQTIKSQSAIVNHTVRLELKPSNSASTTKMSPRIFVTSAHGDVDGHTTGVLMAAHPEYEVMAQGRSEEQGSKPKSHWPSVTTVVGTLDDDEILKEESAKADVFLRW